MGKLDGKVAVITGAASGIGQATARLLASEGAAVLVADVDEAGGRETVELITSAGGSATFLRTDVSKAAEVESLMQAAIDANGRLDIIFNNAGIEGEQAKTADCSLENWERVNNINLNGVFHGLKYGIPALLRSGGGSIINTASTAGMNGYPGMPAYSASKAGVIQLTKTAAAEYARKGIRVNAICPGGILTPLVQRFTTDLSPEVVKKMVEAAHPIGRFGTPDEVARLVLYLASDDSTFCTGAPFIIDGGMLAV